MIAANHMKHIEALRFQREMFFNGYKNQPRFMRLMQCVFDQEPNIPGWWKAAKAQARSLAKSVEKAILPMFDRNGGVTWSFKKITSLTDVELINLGQIGKLKRSGVLTPYDLADMSPQRLISVCHMSAEKACAILQRLRKMLWS